MWTGSVAGGWKTCHVPRRTWLDSKINVFLEEGTGSGCRISNGYELLCLVTPLV